MARNRKRKRKQPHRENVPGELDHSSGEVEIAEASIVAGSGSPPEPPDSDPPTTDAFGDPPPEEPHDTSQHITQPDPDRPAAGPRPGGSRVGNFLRASWAELQRVQWPDRRQVGQATAVVLGFVAIAGAYLGLADIVAQRIVDLVI